jgi:hypothetical protein
LVLSAFVGESRGEDRAISGERSFVLRRLVQHLERIAWLEVVLEVDLPAEELRNRDCQLDALAGRVDRRDERRMITVNPAADRHDAGCLLVEKDLGVELFRSGPVAVDDAQETVRVDLVLELSQESVDRQYKAVGPFCSKVARVEHRARRLDRGLYEWGGKLMLPEDRLERGLPRNHGLDGLGLDRQDDIRALGWRWRHVALTPAACRQQRDVQRDECDSRRDDPGESSVHRYAGQCNVPPEHRGTMDQPGRISASRR